MNVKNYKGGFTMDITRIVKQLLFDYDLTATQLAAKIGTSQSNLSKKMTNGTFTVSDLDKIANALNLTLNISFDEKE